MSGIAWAARRSPGFSRAHGVSPVPARPTSWQTFLRAHWGAMAGADFFTTEVWTWRGLVTFYTVFVIDLASRRVQIVGSTPHPNDLFMRQVGRTLTATDGLLSDHRVLICDRDRKWSRDVRRLLGDAGVHVVQTPFQAPNANAYAERFVRSIKHECLDRMVPLGERHFRRALKEFVDHYHRERNHQGLENRLIDGDAPRSTRGRDPSASAARWLAELLRASGVTIGASRAHPLGPHLGHYALRSCHWDDKGRQATCSCPEGRRNA